MKHSAMERTLAGILLFVTFGVVVHAPITVWLGTLHPAYIEYMKSWKELLMGLALVLLIIVAVRRKMINKLLDDRLMQIALVYAGLHFVMMAVLQNGLGAAGAGLLIDLRFVLFFVLAYGTTLLMPEFRRWFIKAIMGGAAVVLVFGVLQIFVLPTDILAHIGYSKSTIQPYLTVDQNPDYVRINSTLRGPNPLGAYAVIILSLLAAIAIKSGKKLSRNKRWLIAIAAVAAGLVLAATYSRSSLVGLIIAAIVIAVIASPIKTRQRLTLSVGIGLLVVMVVLAAARTNPTVSRIVWHDDPAVKTAVDSNQAHVDSVAHGVQRMLVQPLGAGVGSTGSASLHTKHALIIENQYLFIAHEVGWLGLGLYIWLFVEVMKRLWLQRAGALALGVFASGAAMACIGLLLPIWVDDTVSILWWGLAAVAVGLPHSAHFARKPAVRAQRTSVYASLTLLDFHHELHSSAKVRKEL